MPFTDHDADARLLEALRDPAMVGASVSELATRTGATMKSVEWRLGRFRRLGIPESYRKVGRRPQPRPTVDVTARDRLFGQNLGLARYHADRFIRRFPKHAADIVSVARLGLLKAAETYDPSGGASFATYARWPIRAALSEWFEKDRHLIRLPKRWNYSSYRSDPSHADQAAEFVRLSRCRAVGRARDPDRGDFMTSLVVDSGTGLEDRIGPLLAGLARLPQFEREVLERRFGIGRNPETQDAIAAHFRTSDDRIRRVERIALARLRGLIQHETIEVPVVA